MTANIYIPLTLWQWGVVGLVICWLPDLFKIAGRRRRTRRSLRGTGAPGGVPLFLSPPGRAGGLVTVLDFTQKRTYQITQDEANQRMRDQAARGVRMTSGGTPPPERAA